MRAHGVIGLALLGQRGHLFPWVPVFLGAGTGLYFVLGTEPPVGWLWAAGASVLPMLLMRRVTAVTAPLIWSVLLLAAGLALAGARSHLVAGPVLKWRYYGPVEGRIVGVDRSASDALRLTLADVRLSKMAPETVPQRVRISLHGQQGFFDPQPGQRVAMSAHLSPPQGPVEPGGFDFQRHAWFQRLGGVGYTRSPVLLLAKADSAWSSTAVRMAISRHIRALLPGETGGFAAAVTTGDRSGISQDTLETLRDSNLAHLLAISGLHMGLLVGFVFASLRSALALVPAVAMRLHAKRLAAGLSIAAAAIYLGLSGGNVATQRAFVMAAVALVAVMADRRVMSLRAVAVAATIVLLLRPETLLSPGFHMSFAATTALVAVFGGLRAYDLRLGPKWLQPVMAVVLSSLVAGLATAPYGAAHFNQVAHYGLLANLLSVPVMGILVIPAAVLSACLSLIGLDWIGIWAMGIGLDWILGVARWVAQLDGATRPVVAPGPWVLPLFSIGFLQIILWQGRFRWGGIAPVLLGFMMWFQAEWPMVLVADSGALVGVITQEGRALSRERGQGFVARNWLENDGDTAAQADAAQRWPWTSWSWMPLGPHKVMHIQGKRAAEQFRGCGGGDIVISSTPLDGKWPCEVFDPRRLAATGALAIGLEAGKLKVVTARQISGARLWNAAGKED